MYDITDYKSEEIVNGTNIRLVKLDYYYLLNVYCLGFPNSSFPFGVEKVLFDMKTQCNVYVVSPGNFFSFDRKRNRMNILADNNYEYQVESLKRVLP